MCASGIQWNKSARLPFVDVFVNNNKFKGLVDTGCSRTVISCKVLKTCESNLMSLKSRADVMMMDGSVKECGRICEVTVKVKNVETKLCCLVMDILPDYDVLVGMDFVEAVKGLRICCDGQIAFGAYQEGYEKCLVTESNGHKNSKSQTPNVAFQILDDDFIINYSDKLWEVEWKWENDKEPNIRRIPLNYKIPDEYEEKFNEEIETWIKNGWLIEYAKENQIKGTLPLMAVYQEHKDKVRPVMDFRNLNEFVSSHTGESVVCNESLRKWRKLGENLTILDLKNAYLQIQVDRKLWAYQVVKHKEKLYCLTRLGFGLNVAPKIMTKIVNHILSSDPNIYNGTMSYIDDIIIDENVVSVDKVQKVLDEHGLVCKSPEKLGNYRILGLNTFIDNDKIYWNRGEAAFLSEAKDKSEFSKRELFSLCGKLVGHFPVCNWLRPYCSFLKRLTNELDWDDKIGCDILDMTKEILTAVSRRDPVKGV